MQPQNGPLLVCRKCSAAREAVTHTRHVHAGHFLIVENGENTAKQVWECAECGTRRVWGSTTPLTEYGTPFVNPTSEPWSWLPEDHSRDHKKAA